LWVAAPADLCAGFTFLLLRMRLLLGVLGGGLLAGALAGCGAKATGPLALYFVGSTRFTTGNRTVGPADTLATNLYALADTTDRANYLTKFTVTVRYSPRRAPFAYPNPINQFINNLPADSVTFMDSTLAGGRRPRPGDFLYTPMFGARTTAGTERWTFTARAQKGDPTARSFTLAVRRSDSTAVFHNYTLNLRVPASTVAARRFIDLKSGLALPAYSVLSSPISPSNIELQQLTDLIVLPDGLRLVSPDSASLYAPLSDTRWLQSNRRRTRFRLTTLGRAGFTSQQDTVAIRDQFTGAGRAYLPALAINQVYAFRATNPAGAAGRGSVYGLLLIENVPSGTNSTGLQLQVRLAKQPR